MSILDYYGQEVPYAIADVTKDLPQVDEMIAVVCTGTGIGLVAFMTGYYLQKQNLNYRNLGEISSLSMLSDPIVNEDTGYFESPGVKLMFTEVGDIPMLVAFGPRQPTSWEAHFASNALFDVIERMSKKTIMLSVGGFGVTSKEKMPEIVGRPNCPEAEQFMKENGIARIDDIQKVEGIAKILNAGQGFQAALPMLAIRRKIASVFFLGTALMPDHVGVRLDPQAVRHVMTKISDLGNLNLDFKKIDEFIKRESSQQKVQQKNLYDLAKRFARGTGEAQGTELSDTNMYI